MLCGIYLGMRTSTSKGHLKVIYYKIHDLALPRPSPLMREESGDTKGPSVARCTLGDINLCILWLLHAEVLNPCIS